MIDARSLFVGLLVTAIGWQIVFAETLLDTTVPGAVSIALGLLIAAFALREASLWQRAAVLGGVVILQVVAAHGFADLFARWKEVPGLAVLLAAMIDLVGLDAAAVDGRVIFHAGELLIDYRPSLARLGAFPFALILTGAFATAALMPVERPWRLLGGLAGLLAAFAVLRILVILLARVMLPDQGLEISPWWLLATWLPAALLLPGRIALQPVGETIARSWGRPAMAATAGLALCLWLGFEDPGRPKPGRIVFDDSHGIWEPTDVPFDTERFGRRHSYTYTNFFELLDWHYEVRRHQEGPITPAVLQGADVLILKTPVQPVLPAEIEAIEQFVRAGGGLFLIGDHTNLFGMTTYINALAGRFGLAFRPDDTFDLITESATRWTRPVWLPHPIANLVPAFEFETSATIVAPFDARAVMIGSAMGSETADFNNPGFFGDLHLDQSEDFGFFLQHIGLDHGLGRVAAFSDSTPFSNFSIFFPGRRELALATVAWLNHEATPLRHVPMIASVVAIVCLVQLISSPRRRDAPAVVLALILGLGAGTSVVASVSLGLALPEPQHDVRTVVFDHELSQAEFPPSLSSDPAYELTGYDTFVVASQRLGYMPVISDDFARSLDIADLLVLIHPRRDLDGPEREALLRFVSAGGSLLVVDGLIRDGSATAPILQPFGLSIGQAAIRLPAKRVTPTPNGRTLALYRPLQYVLGGFPVLTDEEGHAIFSEVEFGEGRVGVLAEGSTVSRIALGNRFYDNPDAQQQEALQTAFLILKRMVEGDDAP